MKRGKTLDRDFGNVEFRKGRTCRSGVGEVEGCRTGTERMSFITNPDGTEGTGELQVGDVLVGVRGRDYDGYTSGEGTTLRDY